MMEVTADCPHCGVSNPLGATVCRMCGGPLGHEHVRAPGSAVCSKCGQAVDEGAALCNACTRPAREVLMSNLPEEAAPLECVHWSEKPAAAGRSARVAVAGILILMAGALGIGQAVLALDPGLSGSIVDIIESSVPWAEAVDDMVATYLALQAWMLVAGLVAIFGGVFALTGTRFEFAVLGGVLGTLAIGFLMGMFLGLVGLLLLLVSRKEFLPEC